MKRMMMLMAAMVMSWCAMADTEVVDGVTWTYTVSDGEASVGNYGDSGYSTAIPSDTTGAITIPSKLGGCPVTSIDYRAFFYCGGLTSVTLPEGVTSIGAGAFEGCSGLTSVTLPSSVKSIGDGARNLFASKVTSEKAEANEVLNVWKGNYILAFEDENGWNGLSVGIAAQGKVKVSGKLASGTSVSVTSQLIIGDETSVIPVVYTKKDVSLAFNIYFTNDGSEMRVDSSYDAVISQVGNIGSGLAFRLDDGFRELYDDVELLDFLPDGVSVEPSGTKWIVAEGEKKAGKIVIDKETGDVYDKNESANPSGLKLTYAAKTGTFKGSFKVYYLANGKVKSDSATVTGFVVNGVGYGTATVKKRGSASVSIE